MMMTMKKKKKKILMMVMVMLMVMSACVCVKLMEKWQVGQDEGKFLVDKVEQHVTAGAICVGVFLFEGQL